MCNTQLPITFFVSAKNRAYKAYRKLIRIHEVNNCINIVLVYLLQVHIPNLRRGLCNLQYINSWGITSAIMGKVNSKIYKILKTQKSISSFLGCVQYLSICEAQVHIAICMPNILTVGKYLMIMCLFLIYFFAFF